MPETDPAGVRARREMFAHGWPDYLQWQPDPVVVDELERLTEARRRATTGYSWAAVTDPAPPEVALTYNALRLALVDAGLPSRLAEFAADFAIIDHLGGIVAVVRWTALPIPKPDPADTIAVRWTSHGAAAASDGHDDRRVDT